MIKIPILDRNFIHLQKLKGTSLENPPKLLEWVDAQKYPEPCKIILKDTRIPFFVTDRYLLQKYTAVKKIAWLIEPKVLNPNLYTDKSIDFISRNYNYVLTHEQFLIEKYKNFLYLPFCSDFTIQKESLPVKNKLVSMITSSKTTTEGHKFRIETTKNVKGYDLFGRGFKELQFKNEALEPYMFSIAIENSMSDYYWTEKVMDCFSTKTIPIYRGCDLSKWFNSDGIIYFRTHEELQDIINNKLSKEFYESKISAIEENFNKARNEYYSADDYIVKNYPFLFQ